MKKLITLLTLALSFSFADAEKYPSLKVKDYKNVRVIIEDIRKSNTGLTKQDIQNKVKLTLLKNGFKTINNVGTDFIYINVNLINLNDRVNDVYSISIDYRKYSSNHFNTFADRNKVGEIFIPFQGIYSTAGINYQKSDILDQLQSRLELFLIDYMESNTE